MQVNHKGDCAIKIHLLKLILKMSIKLIQELDNHLASWKTKLINVVTDILKKWQSGYSELQACRLNMQNFLSERTI